MAPEHNMTDAMKSEASYGIEAEKPSTSSPQMADKLTEQQDGNIPPKQTLQTESEVPDNEVFDEIEGLFSNRTESTATDDSGISAEFDYQNLDIDDIDNDAESVLGNSQNNVLEASDSSLNVVNQNSMTSPERSQNHASDNGGHVARTPTRTRQLSTEDDNLLPWQGWWSPHRAVCSESLDNIAEEKRRRSKGDIGKRTAWLKERTESALEKSALVRKRSAELIKTGKRLRNEQV